MRRGSVSSRCSCRRSRGSVVRAGASSGSHRPACPTRPLSPAMASRSSTCCSCRRAMRRPACGPPSRRCAARPSARYSPGLRRSMSGAYAASSSRPKRAAAAACFIVRRPRRNSPRPPRCDCGYRPWMPGCASRSRRPAADARMLWFAFLLRGLARERWAGGRPQGEGAALGLLALGAMQWSSQVSIDPADSAGHGPALWIEIGASSRLFGGHAALRERIAADLAPLGYTHRLGTAPTPAGAALLARAGLATVATTRTQLRQQLAPLPLTLLALPDEALAALQDAGLQCIGELLALPTAAIAQRFGPGASLYLQRLCGEAREPLRMVRPPQRFASRCEFADPVTDTTALLFPLQRLLAGLQGFLRSRDRAVQRYTLCLEHHRRAATRLEIGLSRPGRDAAQLLALARERLAASTLDAAVHGLAIEAPSSLH